MLSACVAAACFAFCLFVQGWTGAWHAGFRAHPDEPAHFVGAVMVGDWLASGRWLAPLKFAQDYYAHYPFFAIGYWPPLFSLVTGLWLQLAGVGRLQALLIPAAFGAGTGWLVFRLLRQRAGIVAAVCAGTLYLSLPAVRYSVCAVMVDPMTTFLCLASAVCLLRYLKQPVLWNGIFCAVACGCAALSKYSAAYTLALPFFAALFLRRLGLLRKPGFLMQPFVAALIVAPWALWTSKLAFYGLPGELGELTVKRVTSFLLAAFQIFPPVLMAVVVLGLIALLVRPRAWREDLVVLSLLCAGQLSYLMLSPVDVERRYLLVPAAVLLVLSFAGWAEALVSVPRGGRSARAISAMVALLTAAFVVSQLNRSPRIPEDPIRNAVGSIVRDPARAGRRIVVPPNLEGPAIAEFVAQSRHRPDHFLLRPGKAFARQDWFGGNYSSVFATPEQMMEWFRQHPVSLILWNHRPEAVRRPHGRIMAEMLRQYPVSWRGIASFGSAGDSGSSWTIYEYCAPPLR